MGESAIDEVIIESMIDELFEANGFPLISNEFWEDIVLRNKFIGDLGNFFSDAKNKRHLLSNPEFRNCIRLSDGFKQVKDVFTRMI